MSGKIFVSYRRSDTKGYTHVVAQPLMDHFGKDQVFLDVYDIELGRDFTQVLEQAVSSCDVLLAMIGPGWLTATLPESTGRRLDDPMDFVRIEIATALQRNIRVIPVLVQNATMPGADELPEVLKPLSRRQAFVIGDRPAQDIEQQLIPALQRALNEAYSEQQAKATSQESPGDDIARYQSSKGYVYVISPQGRQEDRNGHWIDFDQVYQQVLKPAIQKTGFTPIRADEEALYYDISLEDQIQYLVLSEIVIADVSFHDAETFYQLGLRHALRKRGVIHVQSSRKNAPIRSMDIHAITYYVANSGQPDPEEKNVDIEKISRAILKSASADERAVQSPLFDLLIGLPEPEPRALRTPVAQGFWREYSQWKERVTLAQQQKRIGDILILTEEIVNPTIKVEAILEAIRILQNFDRNDLALSLCRKGLQVNPNHLDLRRHEGFNLNRIGLVDEAIVRLENLLQDAPQDTESLAYLGRIYKELWLGSWKNTRDKKKRIHEAYQAEHWLVRAMQVYLNAYRKEINQWYAGINAVTLGCLLDHLAGLFEEDRNVEVDQVRAMLPALKGSLQFKLESIAEDEMDYWGLASLAELYVASAEDIQQVVHAYRKTIAKSRKNQFFLLASRHQLEILHSLDFRPEFVLAGMQVIDEELGTIAGNRYKPPSKEMPSGSHKEMVYFFAGQPIDRPDQPIPVFPPNLETEARRRIQGILERYDAGVGDRAVCAGASAGAEILFCETALGLGLPLDVHLPYEEERYIKDQIAPAGAAWTERYTQIRNHPLASIYIQDEWLGPPRPGSDPLRRNARWAFYSALARESLPYLRGILLWDGRAVDGTYGVVIKGVTDLLKGTGAITELIDLTKFDQWTKPDGAVKPTPSKMRTGKVHKLRTPTDAPKAVRRPGSVPRSKGTRRTAR
jgi:hypothetical protein